MTSHTLRNAGFVYGIAIATTKWTLREIHGRKEQIGVAVPVGQPQTLATTKHKELESMLFKRQKFDWVLVALVAFGLFLYGSYQPRFRLRSAMPADFLDQPLARSAQLPGSEAQIASAYWRCLANTIQWQYGYGHALPADPPPDFTAMEESGIATEEPATRIRYWHRAQHFWYLPTTWQKDYEWNFNWTTNWIKNGGEALHHLFERLGN